MKPHKPITIVIDTREQTPLDFSSFADDGVVSVVDTLHTGDYTIRGFEQTFCVERKSIADLVGTLINDYEADTNRAPKRFNRELEKMMRIHFAKILVVGKEMDIVLHRYRSMVEPKCIIGLLDSIEQRYGISTYYAHNPVYAASRVVDWARHHLKARTRLWAAPRPRKAKVIPPPPEF